MIDMSDDGYISYILNQSNGISNYYMRLLHVQKAAHYSGLAGRMLLFFCRIYSHGYKKMPVAVRFAEAVVNLEIYFHTNKPGYGCADTDKSRVGESGKNFFWFT